LNEMEKKDLSRGEKVKECKKRKFSLWRVGQKYYLLNWAGELFDSPVQISQERLREILEETDD